ncbi:MAG TPA: hypothetical protein VFI02_15455 [Armatimonadota bacterium]|nr:hypothetical protein [Armatimonadota bacterium]
MRFTRIITNLYQMMAKISEKVFVGACGELGEQGAGHTLGYGVEI